MRCPKCGNENPDDAKFCGLCLARLDLYEDLPAPIPSEEDEVLDALRRQIEVPAVERGRNSSPGRKMLAVAGGAILGLALAIVFDYWVPLPLLWLIGPWVGGIFVGRLLADDGAHYGVLAALLPALSRIVVPLIMADSNRKGIVQAIGKIGRDVPKSLLSPLQNVLAPPPALMVPLIIVAVVLSLAAGYFGGRYGERLARGPGWGL